MDIIKANRDHTSALRYELKMKDPANEEFDRRKLLEQAKQ